MCISSWCRRTATACAGRSLAVHRRYAGIIHARRKRTGHFWQGRFGAVRNGRGASRGGARLCFAQPGAGAAGRAGAGIGAGRARAPISERQGRRSHRPRADQGALSPTLPTFLPAPPAADAFARLRAAESIGRPLGDARFLAGVERLTARQLRAAQAWTQTKDKSLTGSKASIECTVTVIGNCLSDKQWMAAILEFGGVQLRHADM